MSDEFYIGWESKAPPAIRSTARKAVVAFLLMAAAAAAAFAVSQRTIGVSAFEWGDHKAFSGYLRLDPCPHLLALRPGDAAHAPVSAWWLVAPFKFGLDRAALAPLDGKFVTLQGTLIYRDGATMIEALPETIHAAAAAAPPPAGAGVSLGRQTLDGEIVDSKCFFGVMNPGRLAPHRACAIRCISGGVPPVFVVSQASGPPLYFLLVGPDGRPVNKQVLDVVAEPLEITGDVRREGDLLILRADPVAYRKL